MKIAVTSVSGQLGGAIIKQLISELDSDKLVGIARSPSKVEDLGIEIRKGDYNSFDDFKNALFDVDRLLFVSGMDHPDKRIEQHRNIIRAAKKCGVKKIVYTSIVGREDTDFGAIVKSNRSTEEDVRNSGLDWTIGRNGIYIEPDLEYIDHYKKDGGIINCAGEGKCGYTSRTELAYAYSKMLQEDKHNGHTYNLVGRAITQQELTDHINRAFGTELTFKSISVEDYIKERQEALGEFLGSIIGGIYDGISLGYFDVESHFEQATSRKHKSVEEMIGEFK